MPFPQNDQHAVVAPAAPRAQNQYYALKAREKELNSQRQDLEERRDQLSNQLEDKSGVDRAGIEGRIGQLDQRLQKIEIDLGQVATDAAQVVPASTGMPEPIVHYVTNDEDLIGAGFVGASLTLALLSPFFFRAWRRRRRGSHTTTTPTPAMDAGRIDRMENAIDSIAVEIERVSENQRFMTRLLTETQLAGTIAAVRGSTEAARVAAERSSNG